MKNYQKLEEEPKGTPGNGGIGKGKRKSRENVGFNLAWDGGKQCTEWGVNVSKKVKNLSLEKSVKNNFNNIKKKKRTRKTIDRIGKGGQCCGNPCPV